MSIKTAIQSYPHVDEFRQTSPISSQNMNRQQQESPTSDSYCSCCCSSFEEEEEHTSSSTICTTPIDTTALSPVHDDNEKTRGKKVHAIEELLQTERDYVQDLIHLVEICLKALSQQFWIPQQHKHIIIRNVHDILRFHKQFIITFDTASVWNNWSCIAQTFLDQIESFKLYTNYCDRHAEAWSLCSKYREKPEWASFLKECAILDSNSIPLTFSNDIYLHYRQQSTKRLQFEDYLIKPVQRICRYQLLIKEIIRYSPAQTKEYELWNLVLDEMQEIVSNIDQRKYERDMKERTDRFIERIESDWRITKSQLQKLNHILIAGAIEVTYSALGSSVSKPRYLGCFVFATYFIMVRPKKHTLYEPKHWFPLRLAEFEDLKDIQGQRENSFIVKCRKHTFVFTATCRQEKQMWTTKLQKAISEAKNKPRDSDSNKKFSPEDFIVSSLSGIGCKKIGSRNNCDVRSSRSFSRDNSDKSVPSSLPPDVRLRRSMSAHIQFEDAIKTISLTPPPPFPPSQYLSNKRYSADYTNIKRSTTQHHHSDIFIKTPNTNLVTGLGKRRSSSIDLLSVTNSNNRLNRMSLQFKNNQINAMKIAIDHKLRDVCTQDYLSLRAWYMREKDQIAYYQNTSVTAIPIDEVYNNTDSTNSATNGNNNSSSSYISNHQSNNNRKLSASFIKTSASNLSLMIPKRAADVKTRHSDTTTLCSSSLNYLTDSPSISCSDFSRKPITTISTTTTTSNILLETASTIPNTGIKDETITQDSHPLKLPPLKPPISLSPPPFLPQTRQEKFLERKKSTGKIIAHKVLQRMKSFRCNNKKSPSSPASDNSDNRNEEDSISSNNNNSNGPVSFTETKKIVYNDKYSEQTHKDFTRLDSCDQRKLKESQGKKQEDPIESNAFAYSSTPPVDLPAKRNTIWKSKLRSFQDSLLLRK